MKIPRMVRSLSSLRIAEITCMATNTVYCTVLTQNGQVLFWPWQDADCEKAAIMNALTDKDVIHISCGDDLGSLSLILTSLSPISL